MPFFTAILQIQKLQASINRLLAVFLGLST